VSDNTNKSITLLKAIDQTVEWLKLLHDRARADSAYASKIADFIKKSERLKPLDVDGTLCSQLEDAEQSLERLYHLLISKRQAAINAPELQGDDKDTIVEAYADTIARIADLHNSMTDLRWAVGEHDADLEKPQSGVAISTISELEAFFKTL
jgi:hypothetical protein